MLKERISGWWQEKYWFPTLDITAFPWIQCLFTIDIFSTSNMTKFNLSWLVIFFSEISQSILQLQLLIGFVIPPLFPFSLTHFFTLHFFFCLFGCMIILVLYYVKYNDRLQCLCRDNLIFFFLTLPRGHIFVASTLTAWRCCNYISFTEQSIWTLKITVPYFSFF